jgi:hypothetical protein
MNFIHSTDTINFSFTDAQRDTLRTALDMRLERINDLITIFSRDKDNVDDQWMVSRYEAEANEAKVLMVKLTPDLT